MSSNRQAHGQSRSPQKKQNSTPLGDLLRIFSMVLTLLPAPSLYMTVEDVTGIIERIKHGVNA
ncbi:MAG: hypothetical protein JXR76_24730 [Deltaproteobacteria bacterium]|nr:hypothetical protein [Deltaproteobacteria bacterium]